MGKKIKALVIGAGPAGLTAAWELQKKGHEIEIVEAQDQPGGISKTVKVGNFRFDLECHDLARHCSDELALLLDRYLNQGPLA